MAKKKQESTKKPMQVWKLYKAEGDKATRLNKTCPKCGPGVFLSNHKDRMNCGKCDFMEKKSN